MRDTRLLIVFVKAPRPGRVKTRLAQSVGSKAACLIYQILVSRVLAQVGSLRSVELRFHPAAARNEIRQWCRRGWSIAPQGGGDLGERLKRAFREAFSARFDRVALIGSDCPELTARDIEQAWNALDGNDVVLGPSRDGGYWLVALHNSIPKLFAKIPWSTDRVLAATLAHAKSARLRVHLLRELADVDTEDDWKAYLRRNAFAQIALGE
ncbi:MAG TPA: TIGR04282 family arsenosugar biosynthesis glycosyltransferase [Candidatus Binatia bacterium]|nr:TIGR04282 family arsenosugar biosynthesis glycosyltransferase [Candidatus Binatia bacterium]